ncbi:iron chelate uptake ABC transporter family permease subunit [Haematomicrobium sanguinis]|uniref:iron chelate uptake ABC transporter family permease subunit n=1 Tax=Haematomicrobium sanguinis TaxID=479106 RepID=UPI00047B5E1E|nr:iron chelate uptake ABC transporter family permease subunit [Haematomicrobium sanguinis]
MSLLTRHQRRRESISTPATAEQPTHSAKRYPILLGLLGALAVALIIAHLAWGNPAPVGSRGFYLIAGMRVEVLVTIAVVALCHSLSTVVFQTIANNRIITPSIMGFEALYVTFQTATVFFLGASALASMGKVPQIAIQSLLMVGFAALLYGWLLSGKFANMHIMLLVGIIIGGGLASLSTFMQRLLTPSEFDILSARLFGSISNSNAAYLPIAIGVCVLVGAYLWTQSPRYDVMALGRDAAINLGLNHRRQTILALLAVSVLMSVTTSLVGPMTFLGFLVATLAYQVTGSHQHRRILPVAFLLAFVMLLGAYFVMRNIFYAEGAVTIIIELIGGGFFLFYVLRKAKQ